jgi:urease accessory protein
VAAAAGLGPKDAALAAAHGAVSGPATAAVRLLSLDPAAVAAVLARLAGPVGEVAAQAAQAAAAAEAAGGGHDFGLLPAAGGPLLDVAAEHHASWEVRLFAS